MHYNRRMFIEDDKLPQDVVRKKLSDTRDALCCLECGFESAFSSMDKDAIGRPFTQWSCTTAMSIGISPLSADY
ncbi:hypothetical protein [Granulicella aggregans]|uniref:hypothetical protein n=1 Tax=Granulicella aggregans TaxID=474949 RepID=UPI0021E01614|nr:hypothetical protein [Granulicella aggregans]